MSGYPPGFFAKSPGAEQPTGMPALPVDIPNGSWIGPAYHLQWADPGADTTWGPTTGVVSRAVWQSPIFDRLPNLGASQPENINSIPLTGIEADAQLHVKVRPRAVSSIQLLTEHMQVYAVELVDLVNPDSVSRVDQRQELTSDFWDGDQAVVFVFEGPGRSRYWRVALVFDLMEQGKGPPSITVQGAAY